VIDDSGEPVRAHLLRRNSLDPDQLRTMSHLNPQTGLLPHFPCQGIVKTLVALDTPAGANPHARARMGAMLSKQHVFPIDQQRTTRAPEGQLNPPILPRQLIASPFHLAMPGGAALTTTRGRRRPAGVGVHVMPPVRRAPPNPSSDFLVEAGLDGPLGGCMVSGRVLQTGPVETSVLERPPPQLLRHAWAQSPPPWLQTFGHERQPEVE
jgi:hypothetical protein